MARGTVLITGCSSGIGLAAARFLVAREWHVIASARKPDDVKKLRELGLQAVQLDVTDDASIAAALEETLRLGGGRLWGLVNNAGMAIPGAVEDLSRELLQQQFDTNLFGLLELTRRVLPVMRRQEGGRIVMLSSILGRVAMPWRGAYNASKFALEGLTDTLRLELRTTRIRVSLVNPGPIHSRFRDNSLVNFDAGVEIGASPHRATYARLRAQTGAAKDDQPFTLPPEAVAAKIAHALESPRPRTRYYVTVPAYVLATARCLMPTSWLDSVLSKL